MPELRVDNGPLRGRQTNVHNDQPCLVGSHEDCQLRLTGEGVYDQHLVIKALKNGGFGVKQLDGTFLLNGEEVQASRLNEGDSLDIGPHRLVFGAPVEEQAAKGEMGGYRLFELLGKGGMGTVYRAEQKSLNREVALKVLNKELTKDQVFVQRFVAEARAAARLSHKNVVHVNDVSNEGDTYFLSMELMDGGSLEQRLREGGKFSVDEVVQVICDAAEGLAYAEQLDIVHRDIKPDNLMLDKHGTVKIADLGLASTGDEDQTKVAGTPHFMSPEQALRKPVDHRSDLYSLGCTFYRLLTGHTPFKGSSVKEILIGHVKEEPSPPSIEDPSIPSAVSDIVLKLMAKEPDERYQSARDLVADLQALQAPQSRKGLMVAVAVLAVLAVGGIAAAVLSGDKDPEKIVITKKETDKESRRKLREANAKMRLMEIRGSSLDAIKKAEQLEAMQSNADYAGTAAVSEAKALATKLREQAKAAAAAKAAQAKAVAHAKQSLNDRITPLLTAGKLREAAQAIQKPGIESKLLQNPELQDSLAALRSQLRNAATGRLQAIRNEVDKTRQAKDAAALTTATKKLAAVLDAKTGWPASLLSDAQRQQLQKLQKESQSDLQLWNKQAATAELTAAWSGYADRAMTVLRHCSAFDLDAAESAATKLVADLKDQKPAVPASHLLQAVQAAKAFVATYNKAAAAGLKVQLSASLNGNPAPQGLVTIGKLQLGDGANLQLTLANGDAKSVRLADLAPTQLEQLTNGTTDANGRCALLLLSRLASHLQAVRDYAASLQPDVDDSGTGKQGYHGKSWHLRSVMGSMNKPDGDWQKFLRSEAGALAGVIEGLRAMSEHRNRAAEARLRRVANRQSRSLVVLALTGR